MSNKKEQASEKSGFDALPSFEVQSESVSEKKKTSSGTVKRASASKGEKRPMIKGSLARKNDPEQKQLPEGFELEGANEKKNPIPEKKKTSEKLVKQGVTFGSHGEHAKLIFVLCMILLAPLAFVVSLAVVLLFAAAFALTLFLGGVFGLGLLGIVAVGVVLSLVGAAYGVINMLTAEGFAMVAGQYELGLSLAIAGVTIIISALLYSGITDLIPYIIKKLGQFFTFLIKKVKKLITWLYKYSTQL